MARDIFEKLYTFFVSAVDPACNKYFRAKRLYEKSPHGIFPDMYYDSLSEEQKREAIRCPLLREAEELYRECFHLLHSGSRQINVSILHTQLGLLLHRQGKIEEAENQYRLAIKLAQNSPDKAAPGALSACYFRLGEILLLKGDKQGAHSYLLKSRSIDVSIGDAHGVEWTDELIKRL